MHGRSAGQTSPPLPKAPGDESPEEARRTRLCRRLPPATLFEWRGGRQLR